jgi:AraC-like DNA-binding protein
MNNSTHAVIYQITPLSDKDCFFIENKKKTNLNVPIHAHKEFELNFIAHASGAKRIVGDSIEVVGDYDLVLITSQDLEHGWEQHQCTSDQICETIVQFSPDLFTNKFSERVQSNSIRQLLTLAQKGLAFPIAAIKKVQPLLNSLISDPQDFYAVLKFLTVFYELSLFCDEAQTLSSQSFAKADVHSDSRRVQRIQKYINDHYRDEIRLNQLAEMVGMTPVAFSRFFKIRTGKNLSDYIIDIRLGYASRALVDSTMSINEICYESGFNNISNFNRIFRSRKKCSPTEFRDNFRTKS